MTIWKRSDGSVALDWGSPGPFVVLLPQQWLMLQRWFEEKREEES